MYVTVFAVIFHGSFGAFSAHRIAAGAGIFYTGSGFIYSYPPIGAVFGHRGRVGARYRHGCAAHRGIHAVGVCNSMYAHYVVTHMIAGSARPEHAEGVRAPGAPGAGIITPIPG